MDQQQPQQPQPQPQPPSLPVQPQQHHQQQQPYSYTHQRQHQVPLTQCDSNTALAGSTMPQAQHHPGPQPAQSAASAYLPPMQLPTTQPMQQQQQQQHQYMYSSQQQNQLLQSIPQRAQGPPRPMDPWPLSSGNKSFPPLSAASTSTLSSGFPHLPPIRLPSWPLLTNQQQQQQQQPSSEYLATPMPSAATTPIVDSSARNSANSISGLLPLALTSTALSSSSSGITPFVAAQQHQYQQHQDSAALRYYQPYRALLGSPAPAIPLPPTPISASAPIFHHHAQDTAAASDSSPFSSPYNAAAAPTVVPIAGSALASALGQPINSQPQQQRADGYPHMSQGPTATRADSYSSASGTPSSVATSPPCAYGPSSLQVPGGNLAQAIMNAPPPSTASGPGAAQAHTYAPYPSMPTYQSTYQPHSSAPSYYAPYQHQFVDPFTHQHQHYHPSSSSPPSLAHHAPPSHAPPTAPPPPPTPRPITTFTWDDLSTVVYQIDIDLIPVCRRASDNYVNGTKLLNLTAMSRGKRDSILKHERLRSVVKCGPMRLKGVWIPVDRARELARAVKVDAQVYPLLEEHVDAWVVQRRESQAGDEGAASTPGGSPGLFVSVPEVKLEPESVQFVDMQQDSELAAPEPTTDLVSSPVRPRRVSTTSTVADALLALASDCWRKPAATTAAAADSTSAQPMLESRAPEATPVVEPQPETNDAQVGEDQEDIQAPPAKRPRRTRAAPKPKPDPQPTRAPPAKRTTRTSAAAAAAAAPSTRVTRARSRQSHNSAGDAGGSADEAELSVSADDVEVVTALHLLAGGGPAPAPAAYEDAGTVGHADEEDEEVQSTLIVSEREREASPLLPAASAEMENDDDDARADEMTQEKGGRGGRGKGKQADVAKKSLTSGSGKRKRKGDE